MLWLFMILMLIQISSIKSERYLVLSQGSSNNCRQSHVCWHGLGICVDGLLLVSFKFYYSLIFFIYIQVRNKYHFFFHFLLFVIKFCFELQIHINIFVGNLSIYNLMHVNSSIRRENLFKNQEVMNSRSSLANLLNK